MLVPESVRHVLVLYDLQGVSGVRVVLAPEALSVVCAPESARTKCRVMVAFLPDWLKKVCNEKGVEVALREASW